MSEDIHKWATDGRYTLMFDEHTFFVFDNVKEERMIALEVTKKLNEQQDTIFKLQDLCGKSDGENAKLRIKNVQLQKENEYLKKRIKLIFDELYCKDRKLEELGVPIECCDNDE